MRGDLLRQVGSAIGCHASARSAGLRSRASGVLGEAEEALGDDVALDLAGAAGDRQGAVAEEAAGPRGAVALA